jgi:histidinol phosphatase-like enzyme (inositol monophosphatase family)
VDAFDQYDELTDVVLHLTRIAANVTLSHFRKPELSVDDKGAGLGFDPVTLADRNAEAAMRDVLQTLRPNDGILGEEMGHREGTSGLTWVLDPIDGTRAYIAGAPTWGTLIAVNDGEQVRAGAVSQPYIGEIFLGDPTGAHLLHGDRVTAIQTRKSATLGEAILLTTFPEVGNAGEEAAFGRVRDQVKLTRYGLDCYGYCLLAMGQVDLVIEAGLNAYDIQGPLAVIEAAGGLVTNWQGGPALNGGQIIAAGHPALHAAAMELLNAG